MMRVVLDTNVLLVIIPPTSEDHDILKAMFEGKFDICVTSDILLEYEEIIARKNGFEISEATLKFLTSLPNLISVDRYFQWLLIHADPDDNKFVDCAIAASCDFIVSDDKHFNILKEVKFPKIKVIGKSKFRQLLNLD